MQRNVFAGSEFLLYDIDNNPIALSKNCALKVNQKLSDVTTKDSQSWTDLMPILKDWSIEFEGLVSYGTGFTYSYFYQKYTDREPFFIRFGIIQDAFEYTFYGEVALENISQSASLEEVLTYSGSLKGIGNLSLTNQGTPEQNGYLKVETDPVFRGSPAFGITNDLKNTWSESYNKTLTEVEFVQSGNTTTLKTHLRDGSIYSSSFVNLGGSGSSINNLSFNGSNGLLTVGSLSTSLDGRYQLAGNYIGLNYLETNFYSKLESDNTFYSNSNPNNFITSSYNGFSLTSHTHNTLTGLTVYDYLSIPNSPTSNLNSIWISDSIGSTGSTTPVIGILNDLQDATITSPNNGQALVYVDGIWVNQNVITDLSNYYSKSQSDSRFLSSSITLLSEFTNDLGNYGNWITQAQGNSFYSLSSHTHTYSSLTGKPNFLSQFTNDLGNYGGFLTSESDTLQTVTSRGASSNQNVSFSGSLVIPSSASTVNNSIWISNSFVSTGSTNPSIVGILNDLQDVTITTPSINQALVFNGTEWVNQSIVTDLTNYYTKAQSDGLYSVLAHTHTFASLTNKPTTIAGYGISDVNSYAPTLTGTGASGTWGISISGLSANSTLWNGYSNSFSSSVQSNTISSILAQDTNSGFYRYNASAVQTFLGLGASAYTAETLQSVATRGNSFSGNITAQSFSVGNVIMTSNQIYRNDANEFYVNYSGTGTTIIGNSANAVIGYTANQGHKLSVNGVVFSSNYFYSDYGMYNPTNGLYFGQPISANGWYLKSGAGTTNLQLQLRAGSDTIRGYIYADTSNYIGFLNNAGTWAVRATNGSGELYGNWNSTGDLSAGNTSQGRHLNLYSTVPLDGRLKWFNPSNSELGSIYVDGNPIMRFAVNNSVVMSLNSSGQLFTSGLYDTGSRVLSQRGNSYYQVDTWLQMNGTFGMYYPSSGAGTHFNTNGGVTPTSYGSFQMMGLKNGYVGLTFLGTQNGGSSHPATLMFDAAGNGGMYNGNSWHYYWNFSAGCLGIGGSATTSGYIMQVNGNSLTTGTAQAPTIVATSQMIIPTTSSSTVGAIWIA